MEDRPILRKLATELQSGRTIEEIIELSGEMEKLMTYYKCAMYEVETKFRVLNEQLSLGKSRNPIESIKTRLKSIQSIQGKLHKLGVSSSCKSIEDNLSDVAGVRGICCYQDDIYMLADCLLQQDDVTLIRKII